PSPRPAFSPAQIAPPAQSFRPCLPSLPPQRKPGPQSLLSAQYPWPRFPAPDASHIRCPPFPPHSVRGASTRPDPARAASGTSSNSPTEFPHLPKLSLPLQSANRCSFAAAQTIISPTSNPAELN